MPGGSFCCIVGCAAKSERCRGLSFHGFPKEGQSEEITQWRKRLISCVNRKDKSFNPDNAKICSRHFEDNCFITKQSGRRYLKPCSIPTCFMPKKSVETPKDPPRKPPVVRQSCDNVEHQEDYPKKEVHVPCPGITNQDLQKFAELPPRNASDTPISTYYLDVCCYKSDSLTLCKTTIRSQKCTNNVLAGKEACTACLDAKRLAIRKQLYAKSCSKHSVSKFTPLSRVSNDRLRQELIIQRKNVKEGKREMEKIKNEIAEEDIKLSEDTHNQLQSVLNNSSMTENSFIWKFWEEQKKAFQRKAGGMRWHPMMVRFAILLHSHSPSAYRCLKEVGIVKLPAVSTLKDYTNVLHPQSGFNLEVFYQLATETQCLEDNERWVCLLHDEISIKSGLVYDQRSGEMVGFIPNSYRNESSSRENHLASHALVFMVVGVTSNIKMSLGYFPTRTATADQLFPLLWKAIGLLESVCNLKVIAATCDKASSNQRLIRMHGSIYKAKNLFALDRDLFFFSDAPHLIKTIRNNLSSSGSSKNTRLLQNNGSKILWRHVVDLYKEDCSRELRRTPKLTAEHIYLTPQSVMRVNLAAQVLSHSVGSVLKTFGPTESQETAKFILLVDKFFDCLNTRSVTEGKQRNNPYLLPYTSVNDNRFRFLKDEFLGYLENWRSTIMSDENLTKSEKAKMFLTEQTFEGIKTTVNSMIEATQTLLNAGASMVLSNRFCQDPLEEHFGRHRCMGIRAENPTLWTFGYQENKLRLQRSLALQILPRGNIKGKRNLNNVEVDNRPLPKIRRK